MTHSHRKHVISPSKLVEGSISVDQTKTAAYTLNALELEAGKPSFSDFDLDVLADASLLLCNMFRYGKIRPRDAARVTGPLKELAISSQSNKSTSFLHPLLEDPDAVQPVSAWTRGGRVALELIDPIEAALQEKGVTWTTSNLGESTSQVAPSTLDDAAIERIDCICTCLYYIIALVKGVQEGPEAVEESIQLWRRLLACHSTLKNLHIDNHKLKNGRSGGSPTQQLSGSTSAILEGLVSKAEKRLQLLTSAVQEQATHENPRHPSPRDILSRRDTSEYSGSSLLSPTSEMSINFGSTNTESPKQDSPTSYTKHASDKSIDSLCSCILPAPLTAKPVRTTQCPDKTPQRKRGAKFALHDSPASIKSMVPLHRDVLPDSSFRNRTTVPASLFKGFQSSSRSNLRQSLAGQSMSSSHLSIADMASSASSMAPSTRMRLGNLRRPLLDRRASQLSLASDSTFGRRAWTNASASPISRVSNLSSASLHTLAPTTDRQMARTDVSSLPHATASKAQSNGAAHYLSSLKSSTSSQTSASTYTGQFRNALSSLSTFFTPSTLHTQVEEQSKAQAELAKVASQHNAEIENFYTWEDDRVSSEEESLHSGSPSDKAFEEGVLSEVQDLVIEEPASQAEESHQALSSSLSKSGRKMESTTRPIYPLSTSISSSYLHASTPTSSPHRGRKSPLPQTFVDTPSNGASKTVQLPTENPILTPKRGDKSLSRANSPYKPTKIDPLLAALEAASRVNVKSKCAVCGIQGVNFPKCHRCEMTFCSRDCRMASGGEAGKHVCSRKES